MVASSQGQSHAAGGGRPWSYVTRGVRTNTSTSTDADASSSAVDAQAPGRRRNPAHHDGDGGGDGGVDGDGRNVRDERAVVGWGTGGDTVVVHDTKALEATVLPLYFRHGNYRRFGRPY